jgi:threonine dehydrogenase-like Zn-dependent dehydrogenase
VSEPLAAACEVLQQVDVKKFQTAAVLGDGKLAQLIGRVLRTAVPRVVMDGKHKKKLALARRVGIQTKMVRGDTSDLRKIKESYPLVVEATGPPSGLTMALKMTEPRGTLVLKSTFHGAALRMRSTRKMVSSSFLIILATDRLAARASALSSSSLSTGRSRYRSIASRTSWEKDFPRSFARRARRFFCFGSR